MVGLLPQQEQQHGQQEVPGRREIEPREMVSTTRGMSVVNHMRPISGGASRAACKSYRPGGPRVNGIRCGTAARRFIVHELALSEAIARTVLERAHDRRVSRVAVRIGHFRQVVPDALSFSWELLTSDTDLEGADLEIEHVPATVECSESRGDHHLAVPRVGMRRVRQPHCDPPYRR